MTVIHNRICNIGWINQLRSKAENVSTNYIPWFFDTFNPQRNSVWYGKLPLDQNNSITQTKTLINKVRRHYTLMR